MGYWFAFIFSVTLIGSARFKKEKGRTFEGRTFERVFSLEESKGRGLIQEFRTTGGFCLPAVVPP